VMKPDMVAMMARQHSEMLAAEAQRYRLSRPRQAAPRVHRREWPWQRWAFRSPIVRRSYCLDNPSV
jgi:hypothetical protein